MESGRWGGSALQGSGKRFEREHVRILGRRIRALREARKWSLQRLSVNSDVSIAAIQKIESGAANPSLLTVIAIIEALGESVDQLISASRNPDRMVRVVRGELPGRSTGTVDLSPALADRRMHCSLKVLAARQQPESVDVGPGGVPLFGYVVDGALRLSFVDGDVVRLAVGDSFHASGDSSAEWSNPVARRSLVLCIADRDEKSGSTYSGGRR
jgi:transcriptional regulator with XRE-family HTH domain